MSRACSPKLSATTWGTEPTILSYKQQTVGIYTLILVVRRVDGADWGVSQTIFVGISLSVRKGEREILSCQ